MYKIKVFTATSPSPNCPQAIKLNKIHIRINHKQKLLIKNIKNTERCWYKGLPLGTSSLHTQWPNTESRRGLKQGLSHSKTIVNFRCHLIYLLASISSSSWYLSFLSLLHAKFYHIVHNNWDVAAWIPNIVHVNTDEETGAQRLITFPRAVRGQINIKTLLGVPVEEGDVGRSWCTSSHSYTKLTATHGTISSEGNLKTSIPMH